MTQPRLNLLPGLTSCEACPLYTNGFVVPGDGPLDADVMIVAEAPGKQENDQGQPFVGAAGKELSRLLASAGLRREDCYVTNTVKHWPGQGNPDPKAAVIKACRHWLDEEIRQIDPNVILLLGRVAIQTVLGKSDLKKHHGVGQMVELAGRERLVYQMYHPAAMLHNPELRAVVEEDFSHVLTRRSGKPGVNVLANKIMDVGGLYGDGVVAIDLETDGLDIETVNIVGVAMATSTTEAHWVDDPELIPEALAEIRHVVEDTNDTVVVHNAAFDIPILKRYGVDIPPERVWDTMMSGFVLAKESLKLKTRVLREHGIVMDTFEQVTGGTLDVSKADPQALANYAGADASMTMLLYQHDIDEVAANGASELLDIEHRLTPVLRTMSRRGLLVDTDRVGGLREELSEAISATEQDIWAVAGKQFNIASSDRLAEVLFNDLNLPIVKRSAKTKKPSTDKEVLEALRDDHEIVPLLLDYKKRTKLLSTYVIGLNEHIGGDGRVHTTFKQTGAVSGRLSSAEPNLQNIPSRGEAGSTIRKLFVAAPGKLLLSLDYSQIELRVAASLSGDPEMLNVYRTGGDIHAATAASVTNGDRKLAKNLNFGLVYGMSAEGLRRYLAMAGIKVDLQTARALRAAFFANRQGLVQWLADEIARTKAQGWNETLMHHRRYYPQLKSGDHTLIKEVERTCVNHPVQGTAAEIVKKAMVEMNAAGLPMCVQIHDELLFEVDEDQLEPVRDYAAAIMKGVAEDILTRANPVPVEVGIGWAKSWGEIDK